MSSKWPKNFFVWLILSLFFTSCMREGESVIEQENDRIVQLDTVQGIIKIRLFTEETPIHAQNFVQHCMNGEYDGTYFHRVAPEVMIQGGDFNTKDKDRSNDGMGGFSANGPGTTLEAEITQRKHARGTVSMARGGDLNSAGSQFFILLRDDPQLDGLYTVFGEVVEGLDVAERIADQPGTEYPEIGGVNPDKPQLLEKCTMPDPAGRHQGNSDQ